MKDEEFNNLLKQHADSFEQMPSSGSFDNVLRKMQHTQRKKRRKALVWLFAGLVALGSGTIYFISAPGKENIVHRKPGKEQIATPTAPLAGSKNQTDDKPSIEVEQEAIENEPKAIASLAAQSTENEITVIPPNNNEGKDKSSESYPPASRQEVTVLSSDSSEKPAVSLPIEDKNTPAIAKDEEEKKEDVVILPVVDSLAVAQDKQDKNDNSTVRKPSKNHNVKGRWALAAFYNPYKPVGIVRKEQPVANNDYNYVSNEPFVSVVPGSITNLSTKTKGSYRVISGKGSEALPGFSFGLKGIRKLSDHWNLSVGLNYGRWDFMGETWEITEYADSLQVEVYDNTAQRWSTVDEYREGERKTVVGSYSTILHNLQLPVEIGYTLRKGRFDFSINSGLIFNYTYKATSVELYGNNAAFKASNTDGSGIRRVNLLAALGLNIGYNISERWGVFAGPQASGNLFSVYQGPYAIKLAPLFFGWQTGVKINF